MSTSVLITGAGTGFGRGAAVDDPGGWFDRDAARQRITGNQLDPVEVVRVIADLVEADETQLSNFVPADMLARMGLDKRH
jgi:hypothetical protein